MSGTIERLNEEIVCMDCVVNEIFSVMARKLRKKRMSKEFPKVADVITDFLENINVIDAYKNLPKLHSEVVELMKRTKGRLNYHDALIALCCKQEKISQIATLDNDFDEVAWLRKIS